MKTCPFCSEQIQDEAVKCRHCRSWLDGSRDSDREPALEHAEPGLLDLALFPVGRSGWAIAAGYFGLFSILCLPAPIAILVAMRAFRDLRENPQSRGAGRAYFGLVMGILFTLPLLYGLFEVVTKR